MESTPAKPVVMASSLTGLLISYKLSREGIDHILLGGGPPDGRPRLGESLNENTSSDFLCFLEPDFREHFFPKCHISLMHGRVASIAYLTRPQRDGGFPFPRAIHDDATRKERMVNALLVMHVDRTGFDRALYQRVRASPHCEFIEERPEQIEYDAASDEIVSLQLPSGRLIRPRYVFDAGGARSMIRRAAGISSHAIARRQHVLWTHLRAARAPERNEWWQCGTNLLRLDDELDDFAGIAWAIPMGKTLSVGVSVDAKRALSMTSEALLEGMLAAFRRRGFDLRRHYPELVPTQELTHDYSISERGFGANWLLAGGAYLNVWFPSSAGVSTALTAAHLAPRLLEDPQGMGELYERKLRDFLPFHDHLDRMIHASSYTSERQLYEFWSYWLSFLPGRIASHVKLAAGEMDSRKLIYRMLERSSERFRTHPLLFLGAIGFMMLRTGEFERLETMANAWEDYFDYARFRARCVSSGWRKWLTAG